MDQKKPIVAVAGSGGFIGRTLCQKLAADGLHVLALRRSEVSADTASVAGIEPRKADLFSLLQVERALSGADVGVYLVHSMMPSVGLTQGTFEDLDLVLADNFARAAAHKGLRRIIYVAGLIPEADGKPLSKHLESRREVERVLASTGIPVVVLRAALVVGPEGSSLSILINLVKRLPVMICPRWTASRCQPIALSDLVTLLQAVVVDEELAPGAYDVAGPDILTYRSMLEITAKALGVRRPMLPVPWFSPSLSALWVAKVSTTPLALVRPLVDSLRHDMIAGDRTLNRRYGLAGRTFYDSIREAIVVKRPRVRQRRKTVKAVCSVQRMNTPPGKSVAWVAESYAAWLTGFLRPLIAAETSANGSICFYVRPLGVRHWQRCLLELDLSHERSSVGRSLFYIRSGLLARVSPTNHHAGRFEFRRVPGRDQVVAAVLDFHPRIPWRLYNLTQAQLHRFIMASFGRHLRKNMTRKEE